MRAIDAHVHLYPAELNLDPCAWAAARNEVHWSTLCTRRRKDGRAVQLIASVDDLLRDMDVAGVERSVLLGWYWEQADTCAAQNRFYLECIRAHPDRLSAFATVHPSSSDVLDEVRWAKEHGLLGLGELSPHAQRVAADDPGWRAVLQLAGELQLPVNLHVTDPNSRPFPGRVDTPLDDFACWAREFPRTQFILAHWGGGLAFDPASRAWTNVFFDTAASPLLYRDDVWRRALDAVGAEKILFGSDYPLRLFPASDESAGLAAFVTEATQALPEGARQTVLRSTTERLLAL